MSFEDQGGSGQFTFMVLVEVPKVLPASNSLKIPVIMTTSSMMNMKLRVTNTLTF